jgi:hypothetical protein
MRVASICGAAMLLLTSSVLAADPAMEAVRHCAGITDSLQRLVCYDKAVAAPVVGATVAQAGSEPREVSAVPPEDSAAGLGAKVASVVDLPMEVVRVTLDNGQVWLQQQPNARFKVKAGDTVQIKKGVLGSYQMTRTSGGGGSSVAVKRLQ